MRAGSSRIDACDAYLMAVAERLWPNARLELPRRGVAADVRVAGEEHRWLVTGRNGSSRVLLPESAKPGAQTGTLPVSPRLRPSSRLLVVSAPPGAASIETHLSGLLGTAVRGVLQVDFEPADAVPVLRVVDTRNHVIAVAKFGWTARSRQALRRETHALGVMRRGLRTLVTPRILQVGAWREMDVLVESALPEAIGRAAPEQVSAAVREVAQAEGTQVQGLLSSRYLTRLQQRLQQLRQDESSAVLHHALGGLLRRSATTPWHFGSWHGAWTRDTLQLGMLGPQIATWDRYESSVPLGFDALHLALHEFEHARATRRGGAAEHLLRSAGTVLRDWPTPQRQARMVATAFLIDVGARRLLSDTSAPPGSGVLPVHAWLLPSLAKEASRLAARAERGGS